eukprot:TRINITY_DN15931_c0_g1_i1.p1 TRINITY_DN15931_c0_g1~~TRINITY_DN15931_c0_g1_i1.p1  ORF type:complete len:623 (+),score=75.24 TRINITY_DN15931_c0_g1_i1:64-1932(+)
MLEIGLVFHVLFGSQGSVGAVTPSKVAHIKPTTDPTRTQPGDFHGYPLEMGDRLGRSSAGVGDLNSDGVPDIAVCASRDGDGGIERSGAVYVLFMSRDLTVKSAQKMSNDHGGFCSSAEGSPCLKAQDRMGYSLANLGDVDGDGVQDLLVGADGDDDGYSHSDSVQGEAGAVYVVFLKRDGTAKGKQKISNLLGGLREALGGSTNPLSQSAMFGQSVGAIGDVDGDGVPDAAVGAPGTNTLYIITLTKSGTVKTVHALAKPSVLESTNPSFGGRGVNLLGDLDGDGSHELVVGAWTEGTNGAAVVLFMNWSAVTVTRATKIDAPSIISGETNAMFGHSLAAIGDFDGDSIPDVGISANNAYLANGGGQGTLFLFALNADGSPKGVPIEFSRTKPGNFSGTDTLTSLLEGEERFCRSMSAIGDVEGNAGFTLLCGAGAQTGGDLWLMSFRGSPASSPSPSPPIAIASPTPSPSSSAAPSPPPSPSSSAALSPSPSPSSPAAISPSPSPSIAAVLPTPSPSSSAALSPSPSPSSLAASSPSPSPLSLTASSPSPSQSSSTASSLSPTPSSSAAPSPSPAPSNSAPSSASPSQSTAPTADIARLFAKPMITMGFLLLCVFYIDTL